MTGAKRKKLLFFLLHQKNLKKKQRYIRFKEKGEKICLLEKTGTAGTSRVYGKFEGRCTEWL